MDDYIIITSTELGTAPSILLGNHSGLPDGEWGIEYLDPDQAGEIGGKDGGLNFWKPFNCTSGNMGNFYLFISDAGNVGIGTGNPGYKLDVCGTIRSTEWIVQTPWWDCKFKPENKRMTWQEKSEYIMKNGHLPEIAQEQEIKANGLQVGKTMSGFVFNIEDNTLDIIDLYKENLQQQKQIEELKKENELQKRQYLELEKRLFKLEKK